LCFEPRKKNGFVSYLTLYEAIVAFRFTFILYRQMSSSNLVRRIISTAAAGPVGGPYR